MHVCVCMYVCCMYACMYVCMHVCRMYACMYACMYVCMYVVCVHACIYICMYVVLHVCMCLSVSACLRMHVCMYVCMSVGMYVCMCMFACLCMLRKQLQFLLSHQKQPQQTQTGTQVGCCALKHGISCQSHVFILSRCRRAAVL